MFVRASLAGGAFAETDTHLRAEHGAANFNWRMLFDVTLPATGEGAGLLTVQVRTVESETACVRVETARSSETILLPSRRFGTWTCS